VFAHNGWIGRYLEPGRESRLHWLGVTLALTLISMRLRCARCSRRAGVQRDLEEAAETSVRAVLRVRHIILPSAAALLTGFSWRSRALGE